MNKISLLTKALLIILLGGLNAHAETLSISSATTTPGDTVTVSIVLDDNETGVAGTAFTLNYDDAILSLVEVRSDFFPLFSSQNITPESIEVDGVVYESALVICPAGSKFAAARIDNGPLGRQTIFELDFAINENAPAGESFPIEIQQSQIENSEAGYEALTPIPILIGIDGTSFPERVLSAQPIAGFISIEEIAAIIDEDGDGIEDEWEMEFFGDLTTANATSDFDHDGYSDLVEYQHSEITGTTDPQGVAFNPVSRNAPGGEGYNSITDIKSPRDFNADGTSDIVVRNTDNGRTYIYTVNDSRISSYQQIATFPAAWEFAGIGDFNADGTSDMLVRNTDNGRTYIYTISDSAISAYAHIATFSAAWELSGTGDFNADGSTDILARYTSSGATYVFNVANSRIISYRRIATFPSQWKFAGIGDFNADGSADILAHNSGNGLAYIYNMANSRISSYNRIGSFPAGWEFSGIGDFNADGTADILARNTETGLTSIYNVTNSWITSDNSITTFSAQWELAVIGNFNADGHADILARNTESGQTSIYSVTDSSITSTSLIASFSAHWEFE